MLPKPRFLSPLSALAALGVLAGSAQAALVAYWDFNEGSGGFAGRTGTAGIANDPINGSLATDYSWNVSGAPGGGSGSINFTGGVGRIESTYAGIGGSGARTVAFWLRTGTAGSSQAFVSWGDSASNGTKWHVRMNDNAGNGTISAIRTEIQGSFEIGTVDLSDGNWHHVASVYGAGGAFGNDNVLHYIDGNLVVSSTNGASTAVSVNTTLLGDAGAGANTTPVWIGARKQGAGVSSLIGDLDEVRIYDQALSASEIQALAVPEPSGLLLSILGAAFFLRRKVG